MPKRLQHTISAWWVTILLLTSLLVNFVWSAVLVFNTVPSYVIMHDCCLCADDLFTSWSVAKWAIHLFSLWAIWIKVGYVLRDGISSGRLFIKSAPLASKCIYSILKGKQERVLAKIICSRNKIPLLHRLSDKVQEESVNFINFLTSAFSPCNSSREGHGSSLAFRWWCFKNCQPEKNLLISVNMSRQCSHVS